MVLKKEASTQGRKEGKKDGQTVTVACVGRVQKRCLFYDTVFPSDVKEQHSKGQVTGRQHADFLMFIPENLLSC